MAIGADSDLLYFAYGSNMLTRRLRDSHRCPSAKVVAVGYVERHRLAFDKVSSDGSGKCDMEKSEKDSDKTFGVIFRIPHFEKSPLDKTEGLNKGYVEATVNVVTAAGPQPAFTYIATCKEPVLKPYHWYKALVVAGALEHGLPGDYIEWIRTLKSQEDPDDTRRAKNERLLFAS